MKKIIFILCTISTLIVAQDITGSYKLTGVDVLYTFIAREDYTLTVTDAYGLNVTIDVADIPQGAPFTDQAMQLTNAGLAAIGINLNVTLNEGGSGSIADGSYYPDVNTITDENGNCVTLQQVLPVTDDFTYQSMDNMMEYLNITHPGVNVLGLPGISSKAGQQLGGIQLASSLTFENFPMIPKHPELCPPDAYCDHDGDSNTAPIVCDNTNCFPYTTGDCGYDGDDDDGDGDGMEVECCAPGGGLNDGHCGDGVIQYAHLGQVNDLGFAEAIAGGVPLTGVTAGYWLKEGVNATNLESVFDGTYTCDEDDPNCYPPNTSPNFHLEWHGVDGADSGLGFGDDDCDGCEDEDGDGTWYDRLLGIPGITASYMNPACGFTQPIFGDVTAIFGEDCVTSVDLAASGLLMDAALANWGGFLTANAAQFNGCVATAMEAGMDGNSAQAHCGANYPQWLANDSDHDFNGVDGRLTMNFDIPCVPIIEAREVVAEFIEVGGECGSGNMNGDYTLGDDGIPDTNDPNEGDPIFNVLDVVELVGDVLSGDQSNCAGDVNGDGVLNVLDIVALANCVLAQDCGGGSRIDEASSVEFNVMGNEVTMTADGIVGGIQMTLSHGSNFSLTLTNDAEIAESLTEGNTTTLLIVNPEGNSLFIANDDFTIESVIASNYQGDSQLSTSMNNMLKGFSISSAYPNPFNPTTQMSLKLSAAADVSVKVFNMTGQLVDVITNGQMSSGTYNFAWDGTNVSSGVYFIQTQVGSEIQSQKIMLVK